MNLLSSSTRLTGPWLVLRSSCITLSFASSVAFYCSAENQGALDQKLGSIGRGGEMDGALPHGSALYYKSAGVPMRNNTRSSFKTDTCLQVLISFCLGGLKLSAWWHSFPKCCQKFYWVACPSYPTTQTENQVFKNAALDAVLVCERFCGISKGQGLNVCIWWVEELTRLCRRKAVRTLQNFADSSLSGIQKTFTILNL